MFIFVEGDVKLEFCSFSYRCEISADAPSFAIDFTDQRMKVVGELSVE
jgi:hypothetical protein